MFLALLAPNQGRGDAQGSSMVTDETEEESKLPPDARLGSLEERLERAQQVETAKVVKAQGNPNSRIGQLVMSHLVGAPLGGGIFGWLLDKWFETRPWLMLVFMFLGFAVGVRNVLRIAMTTPANDRDARS
jgi:ATP synthase protein I